STRRGRASRGPRPTGRAPAARARRRSRTRTVWSLPRSGTRDSGARSGAGSGVVELLVSDLSLDHHLQALPDAMLDLVHGFRSRVAGLGDRAPPRARQQALEDGQALRLELRLHAVHGQPEVMLGPLVVPVGSDGFLPARGQALQHGSL